MTDTQTTDQPEKPTAIEVLDSLTGFDEIAVRNLFGASVDAIQERSGRESLRALAFILHRRGGAKDAAAYKSAMAASMDEVADLFGDEVPEVTPDDPETPAGNEPSKPARKRSTSRGSSSPPA